MSEIEPGGGSMGRPVNFNMGEIAVSLARELPPNARTAPAGTPFRHFANDEGYAAVFAEAVTACERQPRGLRGPRLALVDAPGFIPSTLPEMPGDITLVTSMHPRLTGWLQHLMDTVLSQSTPDRCMSKLLESDESGAIRAGLDKERAILGESHFLASSDRYRSCRNAVRNKPTILHTMDIAAPHNVLDLAHACDFVSATLVFANVSNRGDTEPFHVQNVLGRLAGGATALIVRSSIAGKTSRKGFMPETRSAPRASLCRGAAEYGEKAIADSSSIY